MGADFKIQINTDYIYKDLTYAIIGCLQEVHKELGPVHKEKIYHKAIALEFKEKGLIFKEEQAIYVKYKGVRVGAYKPDFIIDDKVILEIKVVPTMTKSMLDQVYYYLRGTKYQLALLANFGSDSLIVKRRVYSKNGGICVNQQMNLR
jgi:GxxExxY protein